MYHDHDQGPIEVALLYFVLTPLVGQYLCMLYITCMESKTPVERNKCREKCKSVYSGFIHKISHCIFISVDTNIATIIMLPLCNGK